MDERKKDIDKLREFYKNKNSENSLQDSDDINKSKDINVQESESNYIDIKYIINKIKSIFIKYNTYSKYLISTLAFAIFVYLIVMFLDSYIINDMVHNRNTIIVPNVIGKSLGTGQVTLNDKNLKYEIIKRQFDLKLPKGTIVRQIPSPGRQIKENRIVYLTVSEGIEEIKTPDLINLTVRQARVELINSGLNVGKITEIYSDVTEAGLVVSQSPSKNISLNYNDPVNITVSMGSKNQLLLPEFKFMTLEDVEERLEELGLKVGSIIHIEDETYQNGTVLGQFPLSGEVVLKNSYIDLEVVKN